MEISISKKYNIYAQIINVGEDICVILSGGDAPHIGALSAGVHGTGVGASHADKVDFSSIERIHTFSFPAHEDGALSEPLAKGLSDKLKKNVVVICGIHIDDLSKDEIKEIVDMLPEMEETILQEIGKG